MSQIIGLMMLGFIVFAVSTIISILKKWYWITIVVVGTAVYLFVLIMVDIFITSLGWFGSICILTIFALYFILSMIQIGVVLAGFISHRIGDEK